jgi:hypothetical protein
VAKRVIWTRNFEDFRGLDRKSSPLTADPNSAIELVNFRSSEGKSIQGVEGYTVRTNYGPCAGLHNYIRLNSNTGEVEEELLACNNYLWRLKEASFSISHSSFNGVLVNIYLEPINDFSDALNFKIKVNGVNVYTYYVGSDGFPNNNIATPTIWDLCLHLDSNTPYTITYPIKSGKIANSVTTIDSATPLLFEAGHTLEIYDCSSAYINDSTPCNLIPFYVQRQTAPNTFQISTYYDEQNGARTLFSKYVGAGAVQAYAIERVKKINSTTFTCYFKYWEPVPQGLPVMGNDAAVDATRRSSMFNYPVMESFFRGFVNSEVQMPSMANLRDVCYIGHKYIPGEPYTMSGAIYYRKGKPDLMRGKLLKYDGQSVRAAGSIRPRNVTATAVAGGGFLSAARYKWRIRYRIDDAQGNSYFSNYTDSPAITVSNNDSATVTYSSFIQSDVTFTTTGASTKNIIPLNTTTLSPGDLQIGDILITPEVNDTARVYQVNQIYDTQIIVDPAPNPPIPSGTVLRRATGLPYCPRFAVATSLSAPTVTTVTINGEPVRVAKLTVKRGHSFTDGDWITISGSTLIPTNPASSNIYRVKLLSREERLQVKGVLNLDDTHLVWNADIYGSVGALLSTSVTEGILVEIYRTKANGVEFYLEAITTLSHLSTNTYTSTKADSELGALFIDQPIGQEFDPPPSGHLLTAHQGCLVVAGEEPNTIKWSLPNEHEYFPLASNVIDVSSNLSGEIRGIISDSDNRLVIFKRNAHYEAIGDFTLSGGVQIISVAEGDYGVSSHRSLVKVLDFIVGVGSLGVVFLKNGRRILELSENIDPMIHGDNHLILDRTVSFSDPLYQEFYCSTSYDNYRNNLDPEYQDNIPSLGLAFDWRNPIRWYQRDISGGTFINQQGGIAFHKGRVFHLSNPDPDGVHAGILWERNDPYPPSSGIFDFRRVSRFNKHIYKFTPAWIHLGEPSLYKMFKRIRLWSIPVSQNWGSFTVNLRGYRNYNLITIHDYFFFDKLLDGSNGLRWSTKHLKTDSKVLAFTFTLSSTFNDPPFITGYELVVDVDYDKEDILP